MARIEARLTPTQRRVQPLARPVTRPTDGLGFVAVDITRAAQWPVLAAVKVPYGSTAGIVRRRESRHTPGFGRRWRCTAAMGDLPALCFGRLPSLFIPKVSHRGYVPSPPCESISETQPPAWRCGPALALGLSGISPRSGTPPRCASARPHTEAIVNPHHAFHHSGSNNIIYINVVHILSKNITRSLDSS